MSKDVRQISTAILVVICLFLLFTIIILIYKNSGKHNNIGSVFASSNNVYIENDLPVGDEVGKAYNGTGNSEFIQAYNEFRVVNDSKDKVNYEIYLKEVNKCERKIDPSYVKLYLTDNKDNPVKGYDSNIIPNFTSLNVLEDKPYGRLLYRDSIKGRSKRNYKLRIWVSDLYSLGKERECFSFNIYVRSV